MPNDNSAATPLSVAANAATRHQWSRLHAPTLTPREAQDALKLIGQFNDAYVKVLQATRLGLTAARAFAASAAVNPTEATLRAIIQQIDALIESLFGKATVHGLIIPIQKQYFGLGDPIPPSAADPLAVVPNYNALLNNNAYAQSVLNTNTPDVINFINRSANAQGGNQGYYNTVVSSLNDIGDTAKPEYPYNFAVAGVAVIFGSTALTDIYRIASVINRVIKLGLSPSLTARSQPITTNLQSRIIPDPRTGRIVVQLDWDAVPPLQVQPLLSAEAHVITEIFVVRSTDARLRERSNWASVFPSEPADDAGDLPNTDTAQVVVRIRNDGFITRYVDNDETLSVDTVYYYAIALRHKINGVFQPMNPFSNVVRVYYTQFPAGTRRGTPPDWFAAPSLYQVFPILYTAVQLIQTFTARLLSSTSSNSGVINMIEQTIQIIEALIAQAEQWLRDIQEIEALIAEIALSDFGGVYVSTITVKQGGILGWTSELARRLSNTQDESRPPFDNSELTAGFVLVAGGANFGEIEDFANALKVFFKGVPTAEWRALGGTSATVPLDPGGLRRLTAAASKPTRIDLAEDLTATRNPATTPDPALTGAKPVFDANMKPATQLDNC